MCASWDGNQCSFWLFSFSWHKKFILYFSTAKKDLFSQGNTKIHIKIAPPEFPK
jgi:hypothetical protein